MTNKPTIYTAILYRENSYDDDDRRRGNYYDTSDSDLEILVFEDVELLKATCVQRLKASHLKAAKNKSYAEHELTILLNGRMTTDEPCRVGYLAYDIVEDILRSARASSEEEKQEDIRKQQELREAKAREARESREASERTLYERLRAKFEPDWSDAERRDCSVCGKEGVATLHHNGEPTCEDCHP